MEISSSTTLAFSVLSPIARPAAVPMSAPLALLTINLPTIAALLNHALSEIAVSALTITFAQVAFLISLSTLPEATPLVWPAISAIVSFVPNPTCARPATISTISLEINVFFVLSATVNFATRVVSVSCVALDLPVSMDIATLHVPVDVTPHHAATIPVFVLPATQCSLLIRSATSASSAISVAVPHAAVPTLAKPAIPTSFSAITPACVPAIPLQTLLVLPCVSVLVTSPMMRPTTSVLITAELVAVSLVEEAYAVPAILDTNFPAMFAMLSALSRTVRPALSVDSALLVLRDSLPPPMVMLVSCALSPIAFLARPTIFAPFVRQDTVLLADSVLFATLPIVFNAPLPTFAPPVSETLSLPVETPLVKSVLTLALPAVLTMFA